MSDNDIIRLGFTGVAGFCKREKVKTFQLIIQLFDNSCVSFLSVFFQKSSSSRVRYNLVTSSIKSVILVHTSSKSIFLDDDMNTCSMCSKDSDIEIFVFDSSRQVPKVHDKSF